MRTRNKVIKNLENNKTVKIETCINCVEALREINKRISSELPLNKLDTISQKLEEIKKILNIM